MFVAYFENMILKIYFIFRSIYWYTVHKNEAKYEMDHIYWFNEMDKIVLENISVVTKR